MDLFYSGTEVLKGLTDIPLALAALVIGFLISREKTAKLGEKRLWLSFCWLLAICAFLGTAVHILNLGVLFRKTVWFVLYIGLYALGCALHLLLMQLARKAFRSGRLPPILIPTAVCFILSEALMLLGYAEDILIFVGFGVLAISPALFCLIRKTDGWKHLLVMLVLLTAAMIFQAFKAVIPQGVAIAHVFLLAALFVYWKLAQHSLREWAQEASAQPR